MEQTQNKVVSTKYGDMLSEVGKQLGKRKGDIIKRTLLIAWPFMVIGGFIYLSQESTWFKLAFEKHTARFLWIGSITFVATFLYYGFVGYIVSIEKRLWIDSAFDKRFLSSKESWGVALKLSFPVLGLFLQVFLRYALPAMVGFALLFKGLLMLNTSDFVTSTGQTNVPVFLGSYFGLIVALIVCIYYIRVKLRYVTFLFLDMYNPQTYTHALLFKELKKLNIVTGSESFKKALIVNVGFDSLRSVIQYTMDIILAGLGSLGSIGGFVSAVARPLAEEVNRQVVSFAKLAAIYILYMEARLVLYGDSQKMNEYIYSLVSQNIQVDVVKE